MELKTQFRRYKKMPKDYKGYIKNGLETGKTTVVDYGD